MLTNFYICIMLGNLLTNFWFSYILFLVFIGGILILFTYIISLINFKKNYFNKNLLWFIIFLLIIMFFFIQNITKLYKINYFIFKDYNLINWFKIFTFSLNILNIFIINFLFFILIITINFTKNFFGPLRIKF